VGEMGFCCRACGRRISGSADAAEMGDCGGASNSLEHTGCVCLKRIGVCPLRPSIVLPGRLIVYEYNAADNNNQPRSQLVSISCECEVRGASSWSC
jgi:hypothetical protein